jgi:hypothetical protein
MNAHSEMIAATVQKQGTERPWQERRSVAYALLLVLAALLVLPANRHGPLLYDSWAIDWVWADQFTAELAKGNLYPRWLPLSDAGLGSPVFYFYPPLSFHLTGLFGLTGLSTYASIVAAFAAAFAASGIGCWHWLRGRSNHPLLAAAFFMTAPYHLFDFVVRGALAESVAIALIPTIAIGLRRIAERRGGVPFTAIAYGAIIGTHLPLALLVSVFLIPPYALLHRERLTAFAAAVATGIGLAAIYLVPAFAFTGYRDLAQLYRTPNLTTAYWSITQAHWSDPVYLGIFAIIGAIILGAAIPAVRRRDGWAIYAIAIAVIVSGLVPFVWSLPLLRDVQFPYRALPLAEFGLATVLARLPRQPGIAAAAAVSAFLLSLLIMPGFNMPNEDLGRLHALHPDVYEYLPKGVMNRGQTSAKLEQIRAARVPPPRVPGMKVEPRFYFPSWSCGSEEPRTQLLMHEPACEPRIVWTWAEKVGAFISLFAGLALLPLVRRRCAQS